MAAHSQRQLGGGTVQQGAQQPSQAATTEQEALPVGRLAEPGQPLQLAGTQQPPQGRGSPGPGGIAPIDQQQQGQRRLARLAPRGRPGPQQWGGRLIEAPQQRPQADGAYRWGWRACQPAALQGPNLIWAQSSRRRRSRLRASPALRV